MDSPETPQETPSPSPQVESPDLEGDVDTSPTIDQEDQEIDFDELFNPDFEDEPESPAPPAPDRFRDDVKNMFSGGTVGAEAARRVLQDLGYDMNTINQFVADAAYQPAPNQQPSTPPPAPAVDPELKQRLEETQARAALAEERARTVRAKQLEQEMDFRVYESMSSPVVGEFLTELDSLNEEGDAKSRNDRREVMSREIRRQALENLGLRTRKAGQFDEKWITEEVGRASDAVMTKYRAAVGNINRLGRTATSFSPEDEIRQRKPVSAPSWKPGKQVSDMDTEIRDWTVDVLSRAALDGGTGESKL
jgi:hypothetical protein